MIEWIAWRSYLFKQIADDSYRAEIKMKRISNFEQKLAHKYYVHMANSSNTLMLFISCVWSLLFFRSSSTFFLFVLSVFSTSFDCIEIFWANFRRVHSLYAFISISMIQAIAKIGGYRI